MKLSLCEILRRNQDGTSEYVQSFLKDLKVSFSVDTYGNIYNMKNDNMPIMSAHMDTVRKDADICMGAFLCDQDDKDKIITGGILGGDDKCGVYLILKLLQENKKINFVFSRDEEIGCVGIREWVKDAKVVERLKTLPYGLVLDRRGNADIICAQNSYGTKEFEEALKSVAEQKISQEINGTIVEKNKFLYKPERGLCSDANTISNYISCANLSVGYYCPHTEKEYIIRADLETAYDYVSDIIDLLAGKTFTAPDKYSPSGYDYKNNRYGGYYGDYDDDYDYEYYGYYGGYSRYPKTYNKGKCKYCGYNLGEEVTVEIEFPDYKKIRVCEWCLEDLEEAIKKAKEEMKAKKASLTS